MKRQGRISGCLKAIGKRFWKSVGVGLHSMEMGLGAVLAAGDDVSTVWAARGRKGTAATFELGTMPGAETDIASTSDLPKFLLVNMGF